MELRALLATAALGAAAGLFTSPVHADTENCAAYLCLAGMTGVGGSGGPACPAATRPFFDIIVYDHEGIDYPATAIKRREYLGGCNGTELATNAAILNTIIAEYGTVIE